MPNEIDDPTLPTVEETTESPDESFGEAFAEYERAHARKPDGDAKQLEGTVVTLDAESVYLDIGFKTEGILPRTAFPNNADAVTPGEKFPVTVRGRNTERYYELSRIHVAQPKDWTSLEEAFEAKAAVPGTVTAAVKGGLSVDIGVRAFMPSSRSGTRDAAELEKLVGQEISCRIIKLDTESEDVVVDRRVIVEEQTKILEAARYSELSEGEIVTGTVRSLASYGAFVNIGGIDGLLHISDISWSRITTPEDVLSVGQELQLKVLKVEPDNKRISLGLKQLEAEPWDAAASKFTVGQRVTGTVTRLMDFGAFVELEPGIEGLIHVSEMSWVKKVRTPSDLLKTGDTVDAMILSVSPSERRISLGLKQALGDPWLEVPEKFPVGSAIEGPVMRLMKFGAFVQLAEGIEGLVHVSEIAVDKHINHPQDVLRVGEVVKAQVLALDPEKRQIKLSMKQLVPTGLGEYLEEHNVGDVVSGRVVAKSGDSATIELGEGIRAMCRITAAAPVETVSSAPAALDFSAMTSMLNARFKTGAAPVGNQPEPLGVGQVRSFKIAKLEAEAKVIELELA